jgi:hypothetical protein
MTRLTLGKAAKAAGISKPSLSAAIKKGRVSAAKNEKGHYEIDPAELFRVYPPKGKDEQEANGLALPPANPQKTSNSEGLGLLLAEKDKLMDEKDRSIARLEEEKDQIRKDLEAQREQAKRITLLLEHKTKEPEKSDKWEQTMKSLEARIANQEKRVEEERALAQKHLNAARNLKKALNEEQAKGFWKKLFG